METEIQLSNGDLPFLKLSVPTAWGGAIAEDYPCMLLSGRRGREVYRGLLSLLLAGAGRLEDVNTEVALYAVYALELDLQVPVIATVLRRAAVTLLRGEASYVRAQDIWMGGAIATQLCGLETRHVWLQGLLHSSAVKTLELDGTEAVLQGNDSELLRCTQLHSLTLSAWPICFTEHTLSSLLSLRTLQLGAAACAHLSDAMLQGCSGLESLLLRRAPLHWTGACLRHMPNLRQLTAEACPGLTDVALAACPQLQQLDVSHCTGLTGGFLSALPELQHCDMSCCIGLAADALQNCCCGASLQSLHITDTPVCGAGLAQLVNLEALYASHCCALREEHLFACTALRLLDVRSCAQLQLSVCLQAMPQLHTLFAGGCTEFTGRGLTGLQLLVLDISGCINFIPDVLQGQGSLQELRAPHCAQLQDVHVAHLKWLAYADFDGTSISGSGLLQMSRLNSASLSAAPRSMVAVEHLRERMSLAW